MTTYNEMAKEKIASKNIKDIFNSIQTICFAGSSNNIGNEIMKMVVENSNDFTKDIAERWINTYNSCKCESENTDGSAAEYVSPLSVKQSWCIAYQIINNINVYI